MATRKNTDFVSLSEEGDFPIVSAGATVRRMNRFRLSDVLELPVSERLKLVEAIWDSIAEVPDALELTEEQRTELDRRLREYEKNPDAGSPWPEVKERILKRS
jgi:putative addiction module component (TIGR02574 family)